LTRHAKKAATRILAEDLMLLAYQPDADTGTVGFIAGESTMSSVLAGAVVTDLGFGGHIRTIPGWGGSTRIEAVAQRPPEDEILLLAWDCVRPRAREVQAMLAAFGPSLRSPVMDRLIRRGDLRRSGVAGADAPVLRDGGTGRRAELLSGVRHALVDGAGTRSRVAALTALLWASGALRHFDPEIPWTPAVINRAKRFEEGNWAARAATEAVARTTATTIVTNVIVAAAVLGQG
jgi:hypothetical protein